FHASAYRWNVDSVDAALVSNTTYLPIDSDPSNMWLSPRPVVKLDPKTAIFGFQPQFNLRQLNVGSQLAEWNDRSWFENALSKRALNDLPKLHALDDESIPVVDRVRFVSQARRRISWVFRCSIVNGIRKSESIKR
ncbi:MAG: hypothetical protein ACKVGW_15300, partial [Verrucomicrobiia bacterium]